VILFALVTLLAVAVLFHWILGVCAEASEEWDSSSPPTSVVDDSVNAEGPPEWIDGSSYFNRSSY